MKRLLPALLSCLSIFFFITSFTYSNPKTFNTKKNHSFTETSSLSDSLTYKIIDAADQTYGYDIYKHNQKLIHQPSIPCIKGNKGFAKKEDAKKIALLVIEKIRKGEMPPTLTIEEMNKKGVLK